MEKRGRPSKTHQEGELRPCVHCRAQSSNDPAQPMLSEPSPVIATAEKLVDEFIRQNVKKGPQHVAQ